jgi:penicillin-binding protein 1A
MYLNSVYFGHGAWGIQAAARTYFNKTTADLNPAECTLLAGLPKEPSYLDPLKNYQAARDRQLQVLQSMVNTGDMSQNEVLKIRGMPLGLKRKSD